MNGLKSIFLPLALLAAPLTLLAQAPAPPPGGAPSSAQSAAEAEAGEPRATTSPDASPPADSTKTSPPAGNPANGAGASTAPRAAAPRPSKAAGSSAAAPGTGGGKVATDRLELGTATVTGDREQPKVMYIVPWKRSDIGDLSGKPMNSLLDEALAPIDREEFKRQVMYYQAVKSDAAQNGASKPPAQGEK
jgi:hypothetical protein